MSSLSARIVGEFMRSESYFGFVKSSLGGSAQPNANAQTLAEAPLVLPPLLLADKFYEMIRPFDLKKANHNEESRTLAALRDALLPKLISGDLRVPDAERIVGRAV
jgi:type I restriction enzyme S subunit